MNNQIAIREVAAFVYRCPLESPVQTSFGIMLDRPMVLVRVTDSDGHQGWGEVWCNFPMVGAEHRARLVASVFRPLLTATPFDSPQQAFEALTASTDVLALQSAEPGPFAQCIAGIDLALWDLCARRKGQPLWRYLGGQSDRIPVYASGLNPTHPERLASSMQAAGFTRFKLKVGFGIDRDVGNLHALRNALGSDAGLMVDVNQGWTLADASVQLPQFEPFALGWIEEPLRCNTPWTQWRELKQMTAIALAAGENILGETAFQQALDSQVLSVVQPDAAKWGGISKGLPLAGAISAAGARYFPHYLGGGIGLVASAHLLAAAGGDGALEVDSNPNPLRTELAPFLQQVRDGITHLGEAPGIGDIAGLAAIEPYLSATC